MWRKIRDQGGSCCCRIGLGLVMGLVLMVLASNNRAAEQSYHYQALAGEVAAAEVVTKAEAVALVETETKAHAKVPNASPRVGEVQIKLDPERLAEQDPLGLLKLALASYRKSIKDYTCTFIKQERINGRLKDPEKIRVHFKQAPFSVLMNWHKPKGPVAKLLYVEKDNNRTILIHPSGLTGRLFNTVEVDIDNPKLKKSSLRSPAEFGFDRILTGIVKNYKKAQKKGEEFLEYQGKKVVDGREYLVLCRKLPMGKGYDTLFAVLYIYLDKEYLLPTMTEGYDVAGNLIGRYKYLDLHFNRGLTDKRFSPQANDLDG